MAEHNQHNEHDDPGASRESAPFSGRAEALTEAGLQRATDLLGIDAITLWTVLRVESNGCGFLPDRRPKMMFERDGFHRHTGGRFDQQCPDVSRRGAWMPGSPGNAQYARLRRALSLAPEAALQSAAWGLGQVLGANAVLAGHENATRLAIACAQSEDAQLEAMCALVLHHELHHDLQRKEWAYFADVYNGFNDRLPEYVDQLQAAHAHYAAHGLPDLEVRKLQLALVFAGMCPGNPVDGRMGPRTREQLQWFQVRQGMRGTGRTDRATWSRLLLEAGWAKPKDTNQ